MLHDITVRFTEAELIRDLTALAAMSDDYTLLCELCEMLLLRAGLRSSQALGAEVNRIMSQVFGYEIEAA